MLSIQDIEMEGKIAQLYQAIYNYSNEPKITRKILEKGVNLNYFAKDYFFPTVSQSQSDVECNTLLHVAYARKDVKNFKILLKHGANFISNNQHGSTILHHIIEDLQTELDSFWKNLSNPFLHMILSAHVELQIPTNPCDKNGLSHFHVASMANKVEAVKLFVNSGVYIDQQVSMDSPTKPGYSPLHFAAECCSLETTKFLLSNGAYMHLKNANGMTPLHLLMKQRLKIFDSQCTAKREESIENMDATTMLELELNEEIINIFLENNSTDIECTDNIGLMHFHVACTLQNSSVVECLSDKICDINQPVNPDSPLWPGYTGLHFAAHCNVDSVKILVEKGANMIALDANGVTPLDICMKWFRLEDLYSVISLLPTWQKITFSDGKTKLLDCLKAMQDFHKFRRLLHNAVDINMSLPRKSSLWPGCTPFHLAVMFSERFENDNQAVRLTKQCLLEGASVNAGDIHNVTPLHLAFKSNKQLVVSALLRVLENASLKVANLLDKHNLSYLHIACTSTDHRYGLARKLLSAKQGVGSIVNVAYEGPPLERLKPGWTPLHVAAVECQLSLVEMMLQRGADPMHQNAQGFTVVHRLLGVENVKSVADVLLASRQLEERVVEGLGLTHLHVASLAGNADAVARLLRMGSDIEAVIGRDEDLAEFEGCTPLQLAMMRPTNTSVLELLLLEGADILARKPDGSSPLSEALASKNEKILDMFSRRCWNDEDLQRRMREETGLTMLHVACHALGLADIRKLLRRGADVNARVRDDSHFWPGCTPLHVILKLKLGRELVYVDDAVELMLENGADVTAVDAQRCTPVHLAFMMIKRRGANAWTASIMRHQRDFSVNPVDKNGVSHFHYACAFHDVKSVEKLLREGNVDVNRPIDFFAEEYAGYTPLHLAVRGRGSDDSQVYIIRQLLSHGADADLEDSRGCTPLHVFIREGNHSRRAELMKLLGTAANVNKQTLDGKTPMEILLSICAPLEEIKLLLDLGGRINACNLITGVGYIATALSMWKYLRSHVEISQMILTAPGLLELDEMSRSIIHNTVAGSNFCCTSEWVKILIDIFVEFGCDIDQKDNDGKTPLHVAVEFQNIKATVALLMSGADVNVVDLAEKPAFSYILERWTDSISPYTMRKYVGLMVAFVSHVIKLNFVGIEVSRLNESLYYNVLAKTSFAIDVANQNLFYDAIEETNKTIIGRRKLTLRSFLFETGAINVYPSLIPVERAEVDAFFKSCDCKNYEQIGFAIQLQYRKAVQRLSLLAPAAYSFKALAPLPDLCVEVVLKFLSNSDLNTLIATCEDEDDTKMVVD